MRLRDLTGAVVRLPLAPEISGPVVCECFGISRAVLYLWRKNQDFPRGSRTADIAVWAQDRGAVVEWVG